MQLFMHRKKILCLATLTLLTGLLLLAPEMLRPDTLVLTSCRGQILSLTLPQTGVSQMTHCAGCFVILAGLALYLVSGALYARARPELAID